MYDSDPNELASSDVAAQLIRQGYQAVALKGGIADWLAANLPTETKDAPKQAAPEPGRTERLAGRFLAISQRHLRRPSTEHSNSSRLLAAIRGDVAEAALWARAVDLVRARHIESDADAGPLFDDPPPGSDHDVLKRLRQMYEAGGWVLLESAIADLPADLRWLFESGAVNIEQLAEAHRALGVISAADLARRRSRAGRAWPGRASAPRSKRGSPRAAGSCAPRIPRIPLGRAIALAEPMSRTPARRCPGVAWALPVGSLRRGQDTVGDIEIVAPAEQPADALAALLALPDILARLHRSDRRRLRADRPRPDRRPAAARRDCRRDAAAPDRIAHALRGSAGARRRARS